MKPPRRLRLPALFSIATLSAAALLSPNLRAADHGDGPVLASDQGADLADCYVFVDPTDSTKLVVLNTVRGFIVPGEAGNFAVFDPNIRFRFQIENTGPVDPQGKPIANPTPTDVDFDPAPDAFIDVSFSKKTTAAPQQATVVFSGSAFAGIPRGKYVANATAATFDAVARGANLGDPYFPVTPQQLKAAPKRGETEPGAAIPVDFFAGEVDDPFFFDIPGFVRFRDRFIDNQKPGSGFATRSAALADAAPELQRGRDTFAGYNILVIGFRIPITELMSKDTRIKNTTKFGVNVLAQRRIEKTLKGEKVPIGAYNTVDRQGIPGINALIVPLASKAAYNGGTTIDDSKGKFVPPILATLVDALHVQGVATDPTTPLGLLAKLAIFDGDILRVDTSIDPTNPNAHFPNGRRLQDDVVATLLSVIASSVLPPDVSADDGVSANDVNFTATFPYLGLPHQPRNSGVDDNTRN